MLPESEFSLFFTKFFRILAPRALRLGELHAARDRALRPWAGWLVAVPLQFRGIARERAG